MDMEKKKKYYYDWSSLNCAPVPDWFDNAKFGIFVHWGPYSVPAWSDGESYAEWYSTFMYSIESFRNHHLETYGALDKFGYRHFIPLFRGENFNSDELVSEFRSAGARYIIPTAEHHDGFAMWDTGLTSWNSVRMGPKVDFIGEMERATKAQDLIFGLSYHRERHWAYFSKSANTYSDDVVPFEAIRNEIRKCPEVSSLYGPFILNETFMQDYKARFLELARKYQPSFMWIDDIPANSSCPDEPSVSRFINKYHLEMLVDYMNMASDLGIVGYFNNKRWLRSNYPAGIGVDERDYLQMEDISNMKWHCSGGLRLSYSFDRTEDGADSYRAVTELVHTLVDVVSKNGNYLLGVGPQADGTLSRNQRDRLRGLGKWLSRNGEAIYDTCPWHRFGDGNIRYTVNDRALFVILLGEVKQEKVRIDSLLESEYHSIRKVEKLGSKETLEWSAKDNSIQIVLPSVAHDEHATSIKITFDNRGR